MAKLTNSAELMSNARKILLYGPTKNGKTICAASISEFFPEKLPALPPVELSDVVVVNFDGDGTDSLFGLGLSAPTVDLSTETTEQGLKRGLNDAWKIIKAEIAVGRCKAVIFDTVSSFNDMLEYALGQRLSGWDIFRERLNMHEDLINKAKGLGVHVVFVTHSAAVRTAVDAEQAAQKKATALAGPATIGAEIGGKASTRYKRNCGMVLPMLATKTGKDKFEYCVFPNGIAGFEAGSHYEGLADKEPANLRHIIEKTTKRG
jgi:hypothetical protein